MTPWRPGCLVADRRYIVTPVELEWDARICREARIAARVVREVDEAIGWMMRTRRR